MKKKKKFKMIWIKIQNKLKKMNKMKMNNNRFKQIIWNQIWKQKKMNLIKINQFRKSLQIKNPQFLNL